MSGKPDFEEIRAKYEKKREQFEAFRTLLLCYNEKYNLTAITEEREIFHKHFLDSLAGEKLFPYGARVAEIGSGAGFPSIPLKIVREDLSFTLVESTGKKCDFLRIAAQELGLKNVSVEHARAEELGRAEAHREQYDICCARAVARLNTLAEYCMPFVKKGGMFLAYKGSADEIDEAKRAIATLGGGETEKIRYELPENYGSRTLVCVKKIAVTSAKYPRGNGKERSKPIL